MQLIRAFFQEAALFFAAVVRPAYRSLRENTGLAAVSVVLAFGLWIFVTDAENPTRTRVLPVDLPVEPVNVDPGVVVNNDLAAVRVRISVEENVFEELSSGDFQATVDLEGLTVGEYDLPVDVAPGTTRGGLRVEDVLPEEIAVVLVAKETKEAPVVINVTGEPAAGFEMGSPQPEQTEVKVSGPADKVALVTQAVGTVDVAGRTESVDQAVHLQPRDDNGNLVEKITLDPLIVGVGIDIDQTTFSRPVIVSPDVTGIPADGYNIVGISSNPATVTIRGQEASIGGITSISTEQIEVDGEDTDIVRSVGLELPPGTSVLGRSNVTVTVRIAPAQGSVRFGVPLAVRGLGSGLSVDGDLPAIQVTLRGPLPDLLRLTASDITASVNLVDKDAGTHTVEVQVDLPDGVDASVTTNPSELNVTLREN
jgi:YbbR domain-containing protein